MPFAERIRSECHIPSGAVGLIRGPDLAESILQRECAGLIVLARQILFNPNWALHAAEHFGLTGNCEEWPEQYAWWLYKWGVALRARGESLIGPEHLLVAAE